MRLAPPMPAVFVPSRYANRFRSYGPKRVSYSDASCGPTGAGKISGERPRASPDTAETSREGGIFRPTRRNPWEPVERKGPPRPGPENFLSPPLGPMGTDPLGSDPRSGSRHFGTGRARWTKLSREASRDPPGGPRESFVRLAIAVSAGRAAKVGSPKSDGNPATRAKYLPETSVSGRFRRKTRRSGFRI